MGENTRHNPFSSLSAQKLSNYLPALLAGTIVISVGLYAIQLNKQNFMDEVRLSVAGDLSLLRARLEGNIHSNSQLVKGLVASISIEPDLSQKRFTKLAKALFQSENQLRNIAAAPDLIISLMYPIKGNEKAIGLDYRKNASQREAALLARDLKELVLAGPVNLVQGGQGFIGRIPVYIDRGPARSKKFWGLISSVINVEKLYQASGLLDDNLSIDLALKGKDGKGADGDQFFGRPEIFTDSPVLSEILLPYGSWQIAAVPKGGWPDRPKNEWMLYLLLLAAAALAVIPIFIFGRLSLERKEALATAEKANLAKSEFLAAMSHDLRTPLNAIMGFSDMMRMKSFGPLGDAHYEEYVNDIHGSGSLLVSLINDILDLSKIEAGKYELVEEPLDISSLIDTSFKQLKHMAMSSSQDLSSDISRDMAFLLGDERVLTQILNNLLSNAIKFTPDGGAINISARVDEGDCIIIRLTDTGRGMSQEDIVKALNYFEQANAEHSRRHEGTGLGLHLCVNFMKLFGGTLDVESEVGKGTTMTLKFPSERTIHPS